jgi:hypothetical protein
VSMILGQGGDPYTNFSLDVGKSLRIWWWGYGRDLYNVGFPFPPEPYTHSNRVVAVNHGMEDVSWPDHDGRLYTVDVSAEASRDTSTPAAFRIQIGALS